MTNILNNIASMISTFTSAAFFSTAAFGIIALIMVSFSWVLVGVIAGKAPKLGYTMEAIYLTGSALSMIFAAAICMFSGIGKCEPIPLFWTAVAFFLTGAGCFVKGLIMSRIMQCGPNGIIWAIIQSAMLFPFVFGVVFYNVPMSAIRGFGMVFMLFALGMFALSKNNKSQGTGSWQFWTFFSLVLGGLDQIVTSIPFYYPQTKGISSMFNIFWLMAGYFVIGIIVFCWKKELRTNLISSVKKASFWVQSLALLPLSGLFVILFQFPGMRAMAENQLGAMSFPILVGSCVSLFTLYSAIILKEKFRLLDFIALVICVTGQIFICM